MAFALITGASKGIGRAIALELASRKHDILIVARTEQLLSDLCAVIRENYGVQCYFLPVDLANPNSANEVFEWCAHNAYPVDILVNNAGYGLSGSFENRPIGETLDMVNVNVTTVLKLVYLFLPQLRKQPSAYILNLASSAAYQSVPYLSVYAAAKSFVLSFSRGLNHELRDSNVSVTVVSPGVTDTDFAARANVPEKGLRAAEKISMKPEEVARIAVDSMFRKKAETITGFITKATTFFVKLLPKALSEKTAAKFYQ